MMRMAKPSKRGSSSKTKDVRFRVTPEQKRALTKAAKREHLTLSAWLRQLAFKHAGLDAAQDDPT